MSQLSRIMATVAPKQTKKPKRKKKPPPKFVDRLPPWKPHSMSEMQWDALQAQYQEFEDYTCEVNGRAVPDREGVTARTSMVHSAVKIQRWWWMWRFRKWLPERRTYRQWVRDNGFLAVMIEFKFPFRRDPLLLGKQLLGVNIQKLPFT